MRRSRETRRGEPYDGGNDCAKRGRGEVEAPGSELTNPEEYPMAHQALSFPSRKRLARSITVLGLLGLALLTACHTTAGFGQDMQSVGRNIENSANKNNK